MMEKLIDSIIAALNSDGELAANNFEACCADSAEECKLRNRCITAEVCSLGFSQPEGAGALKPYYYFGVVLRDKNPLSRRYNRSGQRTIDSTAERIVSILHHHQYAGLNVLFSKAVRLYERHTIELNTRRLTFEVPKGELLEGVFFYASESSEPAQGHIRLGSGNGSDAIYVIDYGIWD